MILCLPSHLLFPHNMEVTAPTPVSVTTPLHLDDRRAADVRHGTAALAFLLAFAGTARPPRPLCVDLFDGHFIGVQVGGGLQTSLQGQV